MNTDHATPELFAALAKAQGELENAAKNSVNPHYRSSYADLGEVLNTIRPVFSKHGLALIQSPDFDGERVNVTTIIGHAGGGWMGGTLSCIPAKSDAQGVGSATTYLRRYAAAALSGIGQADDDGQAAAHDRKPAPASPPARKTAAKKAAPVITEERKAKLHDLRAAYLDAGVADGNAAEVMLRSAGLLPQDKHVTDLSDDELSAAWKLRFEVFQPTE